MKKLLTGLVLGLSLTLGACGESQGDRGADGYRFVEEQYVQNTFQTEVVLYENKTDLHNAFRNIAREQNISENEIAERIEDIEAFSEIAPDGSYCKVHIVHPDTDYNPEFYGHEFTHCIFGQWHKDNATI